MDNIYYHGNYDGDSYQLAQKVQKWGVLWKKPFGPTNVGKPAKQQASKWSKRFFIVKEGFLLYYPENEKRDFDKRRFFNIHPKGVVPLGGSIIEPMNDPSSKNYAIRIDHEDINGAIVIATESELDREKWIDVLRRSGRVTWKNAELGESMIQTLEKQSLQLAKDSQRYRDQLHEGAQALREEMDKSEELEKIAVELESEKRKIEEMANELLSEKQKTQREMEETLDALKELEKDKESLSNTSTEYESTLLLLEKEKEETLATLKKREEETKKLADQNMSLNDATSSLKEDLDKIEKRRKDLEMDLTNIQICLKEKEEETHALEEEKIAFSEQAKQLESSLQDLAVQKEMTDQELKDEIIARRDAERRLKKAEDSLCRLEAALKEREGIALQQKEHANSASSQSPAENAECPPQEQEKQRTPSVIEEEISASVADLKRFFEDIALEAMIDANKPIIMKNAVHARKSFIRKTKSFKLRKDRDQRHRHRMMRQQNQSSISTKKSTLNLHECNWHCSL
ncbi:uncharacterized protein [Apostichopus japonicus]|uniref:uncharacterized protein isoform X3 n=1 Tax=Stichopus japonicus TaxID=307972 RepID=UPI003AB6F9F8